MTTVESPAARNKLKVTFRQIPETVEQDFESAIEKSSRDKINERQTSPLLIAYETKAGDDYENSESEQITVRIDEPEPPLDTGLGSEKESQQDLEISKGSFCIVRRPPVLFGKDEFINKKITKIHFGHDSSRWEVSLEVMQAHHSFWFASPFEWI